MQGSIKKFVAFVSMITLINIKFGVKAFWGTLGQFHCAEFRNDIGFGQSVQTF